MEKEGENLKEVMDIEVANSEAEAGLDILMSIFRLLTVFLISMRMIYII